jgi:hypothetical protein
MKAAPNLPNRSLKRQAKKNSSADLKIRFLELQRLRLMVRLAECGRFAGAADGADSESSGICANTARGAEPGAGLH